MPAKNTRSRYGWVSVSIHWLMAVTVISMFALGFWMRRLTYYDPWYNDAPTIHKSVGILLFILLLARMVWRSINIRPNAEPTHKKWERTAAHLAHFALYGLMLGLMVAGYLISTADGRPIEVFEIFSVPAIFHGVANQEDIAGDIHEILAWTLISLAGVHALAALKHHFINRDSTLLKMLGRDAKNTTANSSQKEPEL
jgi:cytochrome b561